MAEDIPELDAAELRDRLDGPAPPRVIDVRPARAYREGHLPGAENVPLRELPRRVPEMDWGPEDVVLACPLGESSLKAARLVDAYEGVPEAATVASLAGGYRDWDGDLSTGGDAPTGDDGHAGAGGDAPDGEGGVAPF